MSIVEVVSLLRACLLAGMVLLLPGSAGASDESFHFTPGEVVVFADSGGGHGVGMSQWGARGRALAGQDAAQILAAYYSGTSLSSQGDDQDAVRVLLPNDQVVSLPLSQYLPSVVSSELPAHWPAATLEAQAIASRTYALWNLTPDRPFDVTSTVQSQVFGAQARPDAIAAVAATAGQVVTYQGKIIPAYFHACSPTWTANNEDVWSGAPLPFLRAIDDVAPDGRPYVQGCPYEHLQAGPFSTEGLSQLLDADPRTAVGTLQALTYGPRDQGGRLLSVTLVGDAGTKTVPADTLRAVISSGQPLSRMLLSTDFQLEAAAPGTAAPPIAQQVPAARQPTAPAARVAAPPATLPASQTYWVVTTHDRVPLRAAPTDSAADIVTLPQNAPLLVLGPPQASWLFVRDPANNKTAYVAASGVTRWLPAASATGPTPAPPGAAFHPFWVENFALATLWSGTDARAISFGRIAQWTPMEVLAPAGNGRYLVRVWTTHGEAYIDGTLIGPTGAPTGAQ